MRLYYYKDPRGNFGDDLNEWLWPRLIGDLIKHDHPYLAYNDVSQTDESDTLFIGVGSLLNTNVPAEPRKVVMGAGVAYGEPPKVDDKWSIYAVRGPRSAEAMGLDPSLAVTDSGMLVRAIDLPKPEKAYPVSFFSYHETAELIDWQGPCSSVGLHHIDPAGDVDHVLDQIQRSELLVTEAMHGAIIADALRVPWVPVKIFQSINEFKWMDWCESLRLEYDFHKVAHLGPRSFKGLKGTARRLIKPKQICKELKRIAATSVPKLSEESVLDDAIGRLLAEIDRLKSDRASNA